MRVRDISDQPQAVHADRFNIEKVYGTLDDPAFAEYPTIQEIRSALGDYATVILPD